MMTLIAIVSFGLAIWMWMEAGWRIAQWFDQRRTMSLYVAVFMACGGLWFLWAAEAAMKEVARG